MTNYEPDDLITDDDLDCLASYSPCAPSAPVAPAVEENTIDPTVELLVLAFNTLVLQRLAAYGLRFKSLARHAKATGCRGCDWSGVESCNTHGKSRRATFGFDFAVMDEDLKNRTVRNVERYARKALRCTDGGVPEVVVVGPFAYPMVVVDHNRTSHAVFEERYGVALKGRLPTMGKGWDLLGRVDHEHGGNVVCSARGKALPADARNHNGHCDHCHTRRNRQSTYVLRHTDNRTVYVGRNCLADFIRDTNVDVLLAVDWATMGLSDSPDDEYIFGGGRSMRYVDLEYLLVCAARSIREQGRYVKTRNDEGTEYGRPTVWDALDTFPGGGNPYRAPGIYVSPSSHLPEDYAAAKAAIEYVAALKGESDYEHNLKVVFADGTVDTRKHAGIAVSALAAMKRAERKAEVARPDRKVSAHVGEVGKRSVFTLTIKATPSWESNYGTQYANIMEDSNGNVFVWKSGKCAGEVGDRVTGKCTIKEHGERNGVKQTIITRCNLDKVEEVSPA